jgi:hypothetical protein
VLPKTDIRGYSVKFEGLLIKESLKDESVLNSFQITRTEVWNVEDEASFQPSTWTAVGFEGDESQADAMADRLSRSLHPDWYGNIVTEQYSFVVFGGKVFKYLRGDKRGRAEAQAYGRSLGLPEKQLEWGEDYPLT